MQSKLCYHIITVGINVFDTLDYLRGINFSPHREQKKYRKKTLNIFKIEAGKTWVHSLC